MRLGDALRRARPRVPRGRRDGRDEIATLLGLTDEEIRYVTSLHDESVPLPSGARAHLAAENPELRELKSRYADLDLPVTTPSRWHGRAVESFFDLSYFRGETLIYWHYRELPKTTRLKYLLYLKDVAARDDLGLLQSLGEDGAFGCWSFSYPEYGLVSRDLIESANELGFLERELHISNREPFSVLDIGAGYGRLAHRMSSVARGLVDYCCVDAIPESTFVCDYYLRHRGVSPPARVVPLDEVEDGLGDGIDLVVNVHSFSECPYAAVEWWLELVRELEIPHLFIVPNEPRQLLTLEVNGSRRDYQPLLERLGYRLERCEPVVRDEATREAIDLQDHFHLYSLEG